MRLRHSLLVFLLVIAACGWMKELKKPVMEFFELVQADDTQGAYDRTSAAFRSSTDLARFQRFLETSGLIHYASGSWGSVSFKNNTGTVEGTVTTTDGRVIPLTVHLVRFGTTWQIQRIQLAEAGVSEEPAREVTAAVSATEIPPTDMLGAMAVDAVARLGDAINREDYADFHGWIAEAWQSQIAADDLKNAFRSFKENNVDITIVKGVTPEFGAAPAFDDSGLLVTQGSFPTQPYTVYFELSYYHENGQWKLFGINVNAK